LLFVTDAPEEPPADSRDVLIREQAEKSAALEALVADLREQLETVLRERSRNSGNSSLPPSSDDAVPEKGQPSRQQRRAAGRAAGKKRGKQPGSPRHVDDLGSPGPDRGPLPAGRAACAGWWKRVVASKTACAAPTPGGTA
jgi:hypothetical protein